MMTLGVMVCEVAEPIMIIDIGFKQSNSINIYLFVFKLQYRLLKLF